jgi:surfactin synthase thioesterase subunit
MPAEFRPWALALSPRIDVRALRLPGRAGRLHEPSFTRLGPLTRTLAEALAPVLDPPYALFGHSMGALVSWDLVRCLRRKGLPEPIRLIVAACRAPHLPDRLPPIHELPDDEFHRELRRFNGTPEFVFSDEALLAYLGPVLRSDFELCETYVYEADEPLDVPISAIGGAQDPTVAEWELAAWKVHTTADFRSEMFPGDHFFVRSSSAQVLASIEQDLGMH